MSSYATFFRGSRSSSVDYRSPAQFDKILAARTGPPAAMFPAKITRTAFTTLRERHGLAPRIAADQLHERVDLG
jgi:hypothetical protein